MPGIASEKKLGTTDGLLFLTNYLQSFLDLRAESRIFNLTLALIIFSVNHKGLLYKLKPMGIDKLILLQN